MNTQLLRNDQASIFKSNSMPVIQHFKADLNEPERRGRKSELFVKQIPFGKAMQRLEVKFRNNLS